MKTFFIRMTWITLCLLIMAPVALSQEEKPTPTPTPTPPPPIIYTGKLMGYFRSPSLQDSKRQGCPLPPEAEHGSTPNQRASDAAHAFLFPGMAPASKILVGMGDNFAPQLEARVFSRAPDAASSGATKGRLAPANKELYSWYKEGGLWIYYEKTDEIKELKERLLTGTNTIPSDNVACFLAEAGYAAVVPGKHDFYFGPERLRQLAWFMADKKNTGYDPVQMLGANLVIKTTPVKTGETAPEPPRWGWPKKLSVVNVADSGAAYPWFSYVRVKLAEFAPNSKAPARLREIAEKDVLTEAEFQAALDKFVPLPADEQTKKDLAAGFEMLSKRVASVCPTGKDRNDIRFDGECKSLSNRSLTFVGNAIVEDLRLRLTSDTPTLAPDKNYGLVLETNKSQKKCPENDKEKETDTSCIRFSTRLPFFHFRAPHESQAGHKSPDPDPYVFLEKENAAIFGVVDPELGEHVGVLNFSWRNANPENSTVVSVEDPVEALQTQLDFFKLMHPKFDGVKILLAQMGPERARALGAHFPEFQIVVTAADGERSTSELTFTTTWAEGPHAKAFVAVPSPYFDPEQRDWYEGIVHLGKIDVSYVKDFSQEKYVRNVVKPPAAWLLSSSRIDPQEVCLPKPTGDDPTKGQYVDRAKPPNKCLTQTAATGPQPVDSTRPVKVALTNAPQPQGLQPSFLERVNLRLEKCQSKIDPADYFNNIQLLTLCLMRERVGADVALIQKRDFFNELPDSTLKDENRFQEALDRILWKGDLLSLLYVSGDALKNALDQSKKFDGEDANALSLADERARGLQFIGVHFDSTSKKYVINEMPLDDKKIYAVATTDYVGAGDTGYPDLASAALNPKNRADKFPKDLIPISGLVCRGLFEDTENGSTYCLSDLITAKYLDATNLTADSAGQPLTFGSKLAKFFKPTDYQWSEPLSLDERVQRRPIWVLSLKNLSVTASSLSNNLSDDDVGKKFGGVSASGVTATKTHTVATNIETRFSRSSHDYEFFLGSNVDYKLQSTGDDKPKIDQLANRVTAEAGIVRNLLGGRGRSRLGATFTFHTEVPLAKPFTMFKLSGNDKLKITQSRNLKVLPRIGMRWQSDTNYFEGGAQVGREYRALGGYRFNTTSELCLPNAAETFGACISRLNQTTPPSVTKDTAGTAILERRRRAGLYWKAGLSIPLGAKFKYEFTDEGNFFFNSSGDNATDTRLWDSQKHSFKWSVLSNLSIGPSLQFLFFRNKVNHDFLFQKQLGIEMSFAFDLFNRREKGVQLQHKP